MSNTPSTAKNSVYSIGAFAWPLALAFFTTPFLLHRLGQTPYGLLALVASFVSVFGSLDFGVAPSLVQYLASRDDKHDDPGLNRIFSSAVSFYVIVGIIGGIGIALLPHLLSALSSKFSASDLHIAYILFAIAGGGFFINMIMSAFSAVPSALQRFDITSKINIVVTTVSTLGAVALVAAGLNVIAVITVGTICSVGALVAYARINHRLLPKLKLQFELDRSSLKQIFQFSSYAFLANMSGIIIAQLDRIILGIMLGPTAVTYYVIPGNLTVKILNFVVAATAVIFPLTASLMAKSQTDQLHSTYLRSTRIINFLLVLTVMPMMIFAHSFLLHWVGPQYAAHSTLVLQVLLATYLISSLHVIPFLCSFGAGKPKYSALYALSVAILNVIFIILLIPRYNIDGAAWAYLIAVVPTTLFFVRFIERKVVNLPAGGFYSSLLLRLGAIAIFELAMAALLNHLISSLSLFVLAYVLTVAAGVGLAYLLGILAAEDLALLRRMIPGRAA